MLQLTILKEYLSNSSLYLKAKSFTLIYYTFFPLAEQLLK